MRDRFVADANVGDQQDLRPLEFARRGVFHSASP
jgi:hypothetical protein